MIKQVTISVSQSLYQRLRELARSRNLSVDVVLETAVSLIETESLDSVTTPTAAMGQEEAAYRKQHPELIKNHLGQYVAIYRGQLIDHDTDETVLLRRLEEKYPNETVLMKQVQPLPQSELRFRSPRLLPQSA